MTPHAITQYIGYRWKAKDRHGVHSPFAYELNEKVLHHTEGFGTIKHKGMSARYNALLGKLLEYYNYSSLLQLPPDSEDEQTRQDVLLMQGDAPGQWVSLFNRYKELLKDNSIVLVNGIHTTKRHTAKWHRLHTHPRVRMSIDLYGVGLLFFRADFKEKQHFVLKY